MYSEDDLEVLALFFHLVVLLSELGSERSAGGTPVSAEVETYCVTARQSRHCCSFFICYRIMYPDRDFVEVSKLM